MAIPRTTVAQHLSEARDIVYGREKVISGIDPNMPLVLKWRRQD
jgi:hypothetical protein